jgi:anti-sigma regulatory factor (Ser/Thr protein kinase)
MLRHHMSVITADNRLKREVQRVTASTASTAAFSKDLTALEGDRKPDLVIVDARTERAPVGLHKKAPETSKIIFIVGDDHKITDDLPVFSDGHVVSVMSHGDRFDADEFIASATKALRGNIFGLNKYFPWGVTTFSMVVKSYADKNKAIDVLMQYANLAGVRGPVRERIQTVADELMMNALYHAPVDKDGKELYRDRTLKELVQLPEVPAIEVQYGSTGRYFGLSVRDGGGSLSRERAMQYLLKARSTTPEMEQKVGGAGLGLVSVLRSVSKLVFNLEPGKSTEVVGLFDIELFAKGQIGARSLHVFTAVSEPEPEEADDDDQTQVTQTPSGDDDDVPDVRGGRKGAWILAAILLSVVTALGTAVVLKKIGKADAITGPDDPRCLQKPDDTAPTPR